MGSNENPNKGHRQRVKERFLNEGNLDSFQDYEVLELILFYAYPMKDTKPIAKRLINMYGSLHNVLNTEPKQLMEEAKVTENIAVYISMFPHVMRRYTKSFYKKGQIVDCFSTAVNLFSGLLKAQPFESFYLVSLDIGKKIIAIDRINDGNAVEVALCYDNILKKALLNKASFAIIGHNHPSGFCEPSENDYKITGDINRGLELLGIKLLDHIIICGDKNYSFARNRFFGLNYNK
ncbi:MAG: JAB domain-containing protein [Clostridia bacterium]|nr:JAB domain-containing protein [Clostridia bacterium]